LLAALGAEYRSCDGELAVPGYRLARPTTPAQDWADSGVAELTGRTNGPTLAAPGQPATVARAGGLALELLTGGAIRIDGATLLGQRARHFDARRRGDQSVNRSARLIRAVDGWFALNLSRSVDLELVPALVEADSVGPDDVWPAVGEWARGRSVAWVEQRATLLGLAAGVYRAPRSAAPFTVTRLGPTAPPVRRPVAVNLGSLWAAPLAAHLLALNGAQIVDIESSRRPDGARASTPDFYRALHAGSHREVIELDTPPGQARLRSLVEGADIVITGSRNAALTRLGVAPRQVEASRPRIWLCITGHGMTSDRVAFGDDAAVAGGLAAWDGRGPVFVGDAIADPLSGLLAAIAGVACLAAGGSWLVEVDLAGAASYAAARGRKSLTKTVI
jgi:hypothetical protein